MSSSMSNTCFRAVRPREGLPTPVQQQQQLLQLQPSQFGTVFPQEFRQRLSTTAYLPSSRFLSSQFMGKPTILERNSSRISGGWKGKRSRSAVGAAYARNGSTAQGRYQQVRECQVFPHFPSSRKPKGIIKFLGGAFIGASPDIAYSHFIELLAKEGFIIVATPYNVTFDHAVSAKKIHIKFNDCLTALYNYGLFPSGPTGEELSRLPVYSVGHSNGALMQVLIGSLCAELPGHLPKANALISFNNKPASDAVPFFEQMGPTLSQAVPFVQSSPLTSVATNFAAEAIKAVQNSSIPLPPGINNNDLQSVQRFFQQIPGVFSQVTQGVSEFTPTPLENRKTIATKYTIPNNLLIKFTDDTIDESDLVESSLKLRSELLGGTFKKLILTGTHATPLAQDPKWEAGKVFTPVDAVAQAVRYAALADLRNLVRRIADWFDILS